MNLSQRVKLRICKDQSICDQDDYGYDVFCDNDSDDSDNDDNDDDRDGVGYKSIGKMPGPVSTGSMVCALPRALLPCAGEGQYGHHHSRGGNDDLMVVMVIIMVVIMMNILRVTLNKLLLGIGGSFNVIKCAVLTLKIIWVSIRTSWWPCFFCNPHAISFYISLYVLK